METIGLSKHNRWLIATWAYLFIEYGIDYGKEIQTQISW